MSGRPKDQVAVEPVVPPRYAVRLAVSLRTQLMRLADRLVPAPVVLLDHSFGFERTMLLRTAAKLQIADHLVQGPQTAEELAATIGRVNVDALHRTLRALASIGVFELDEQGRFRNNRVSEALRKGIPASMNAWATYCGSKSNLAAWADYEETVATGKNAFSRVHGKDCWAYFNEHPDEGSAFAQSMADVTDLQAPAIAEADPFRDIGVLCDVAGGRGSMLSAVLQRHPKVRGWLFDEAQVLESAPAFLRARGVADRVELKPGNMFNDIPPGAEAYLLKDILHDWDDDRSLAILKNVRRAMNPGGRVLLAEILVERTSSELPGPMVDCHMLAVLLEGRQRSLAEFRTLLTRAGFELARVVQTSAPATIIEGTAV
jgi:hypothetical protein